jgi:hypothetical protein
VATEKIEDTQPGKKADDPITVVPGGGEPTRPVEEPPTMVPSGEPTKPVEEPATMFPSGEQTIPAEEAAAMFSAGEPSQPVEETPTHLPPGGPVKPPRTGMGRPIDYWLLWLVALGSIALNVWLINTLLTIRRQVDVARLQVAQGLTEAASGVGQMSLGNFEYNVEVNDAVPIHILVPVSETIKVPISNTLKINSAAVANLPLLGPTSIPFSVNVPVQMSVSVPVSLTVVVSDSVPVHFFVPVNINLDETPLASFKGEVQSYLLDAARQLQQPGGP